MIYVSLVSFITESNIYPVMAGVLSALVILLVVGGAVIFSQKKKKKKKAKGKKQNLPFPDSLHSHGFFGLFVDQENGLKNFFNNTEYISSCHIKYDVFVQLLLATLQRRQSRRN